MQVEGETVVTRRQLDWGLAVKAEFSGGAESHLAAPQGDARLRG